MVEIDAALRVHSLQTRLLLQIHDELLFEVPLTEVDTVKAPHLFLFTLLLSNFHTLIMSSPHVSVFVTLHQSSPHFPSPHPHTSSVLLATRPLS